MDKSATGDARREEKARLVGELEELEARAGGSEEEEEEVYPLEACPEDELAGTDPASRALAVLHAKRGIPTPPPGESDIVLQHIWWEKPSRANAWIKLRGASFAHLERVRVIDFRRQKPTVDLVVKLQKREIEEMPWEVTFQKLKPGTVRPGAGRGRTLGEVEFRARYRPARALRVGLPDPKELLNFPG